MWKIFFEYSDSSKATITGKTQGITLDQAVKYHNNYGVRAVKSTYQKYPKKDNEPIELYELIEQMQESIEESE